MVHLRLNQTFCNRIFVPPVQTYKRYMFDYLASFRSKLTKLKVSKGDKTSIEDKTRSLFIAVRINSSSLI